MTQLVPATCVLGPGMTGLTIGLRVLNLDGTVYAAFSTTGIAETSTAGTYRKAGGVVAPLAGGYIVWGTALVDYAEATVESTSANVTMQQGVAVAAADANGNVPTVLYGTQPAVTFGQVKILADIEGEGALHVVNSATNGTGQYNSGGGKGQYNHSGNIGQYNQGDNIGQYNYGDNTGQYNYGETVNVGGVDSQGIRDAMKLAPTAGAPAAGSVDKHLDDLLTAGDPWSTPLPGAYGAGTAGALLSGIDSNVDLLLAVDTSTTDATTAGAISRRRGNSWALPLTIGAITGYTSLWFTIKSSYDDADTAALVQVKLNSPSALDGLLYVNGTTASSAALGSITVSDATTGAIVVNVDETITDDLAPGTYYYDAQTLISGNVATPDSGVFTVTADVTRSVA